MSAFAALNAGIKKMPDGSGRITFVIEPDQLTDVINLLETGRFYGVAQLIEHTPYGQQAKDLWQSSFFRSPAVWEAVGTDEQYQEWARKQLCVITGGNDWYEDKGEKRCDYAHVRRASDAGTAYKPRFMGVPLRHDMHQLQHDSGELAVCQRGRKRVNTPQEAREWFDRKALEMVHRWAWETLKGQLGFEHWNEVPPRITRKWAAKHQVAHLLPAIYR